jgi:hypothetical protein
MIIMKLTVMNKTECIRERLIWIYFKEFELGIGGTSGKCSDNCPSW